MTTNSKLSLAARHELWRRGNLRWKLHAIQQQAYDFVRSKQSRHVVLALHRGCGKSYYSCVEVIEAAIRGRHAKYIGPSAKLVRQIAFPIFKQILSDCPDELKPKFRYVDGLYEFPSGGTVMLAGSEAGSADSMRGTTTHVAVFDEEGFMSDPDYVVRSVIMPRLTEDGVIIHPSTAALSPSHPYSNRMRDADRDGYLFRCTVYDNPDLSARRIQDFVNESGGADTTHFRREYLCEICTEETAAVVPESSRLRIGESQAREVDDRYVSLRVQLNRLSVALFARMRGDTLYVEHEWHKVGADTASVARGLQEAERGAWNYPATPLAPLRVADDRGPFSDDLGASYGLPAMKLPDNYDDQAALGELRTMIRRGTLVVHPRCELLIRHIQDAVWNDGKTGFDSSGDFGRFDGVRALMYLVRILRRYDAPGVGDRKLWKTMIGGGFRGRR